MDHSTLMKSNYANIWELLKTILQAKMQIISLYIDLIDSNLNKHTRCIVKFEIELKYLKLWNNGKIFELIYRV